MTLEQTLTQALRAGRDERNVLLPLRHVCARYGVVDRTIARWVVHPKMLFPQPIVINGRRYWNLVQLQSWEAGQTAKRDQTKVAA